MSDRVLQEKRILTVNSGELSLSVDPEIAARVTEMNFRGSNLLADSSLNPNNWGTTYWTSPQADWGWPPVPEVDSLPYEVAEVNADAVTLLSPEARIGERVFRVAKTFSATPLKNALDAVYTIRNEGTAAFSMANWEIMRVPAGGLTFFPTGQAELTPIAPHDILPTEKAAGTTFFEHSHFTPGRCQKLHADGEGGYLAHLSGELLILKVFEDSPVERQAPGEGECEIFANDDGKYVEVEVQGPYESIAPGQQSSFRIRTGVYPLPQGLERRERAKIRAFADECAEALRD